MYFLFLYEAYVELQSWFLFLFVFHYEWTCCWPKQCGIRSTVPTMMALCAALWCSVLKRVQHLMEPCHHLCFCLACVCTRQQIQNPYEIGGIRGPSILLRGVQMFLRVNAPLKRTFQHRNVVRKDGVLWLLWTHIMYRETEPVRVMWCLEANSLINQPPCLSCDWLNTVDPPLCSYISDRFSSRL